MCICHTEIQLFPTRETEGQRISNTPDEYIIQASFVKSINLLIFIDHQVCTKHWCEDREVTRISAVRELTLNWSLLNSKSQFLYSTCQRVLGARSSVPSLSSGTTYLENINWAAAS